jgi:hypothetical protein
VFITQEHVKPDGTVWYKIGFNRWVHGGWVKLDEKGEMGDGPTPLPEQDKFDRVMEFIFRWEGGYVNDPADPGGETKYGISKNANPRVDIKNLTKADAKKIYHDKYWRGSGADQYEWPMSLMIMDTAVLHGVGAATAWLAQYGANIVAFENKRRYVYSVSANSERYGRAWNRRLDELMKEAGFETE